MNINSYRDEYGSKFKKSTYVYFFNERDSSVKIFIGLLAGVSFCFLSFFFLIPIVIDSFNGHLMETIKGSSDQTPFVTTIGFFFSIWVFIAFGLALLSFAFLSFSLLSLKEAKEECVQTWKEAVFSLYLYDKEFYEMSVLALSVIVANVAVPLLYLLPTGTNYPLSVFGLYFISFIIMGLSDLFRFNLLEFFLQKKEVIDTASVEESDKETLLAFYTTSIARDEYRLPHFKSEVTTLLIEIHTLISNSAVLSFEEKHMVMRMLKEEIPAILATFETMDSEGKQTFTPHFLDCFVKMNHRITALNEGNRDLITMDATKIIEIIKQRY